MLLGRADVVIVGAGYAGCATARALAARGVPSIIVEREPAIGRHASGRGAGLGRQLAEDDDTTELVIRGAQRLRSEFAEVWTASGGVLAFDRSEPAARYRARAARYGIEVAEVSRGQLARWWPLGELAVTEALWIPSDGVIDPARLLARLAEGLDIRLATPATTIAEGEVITERGTFDARVVVDASGAWAGQWSGDRPLEVLRRHLFVVEAARTDAPYFWHLGERELYMRSDAGGVLASGCDSDPATPGDQRPADDAEARFRDRFSGMPLAARPLARWWACQRTFAPDRRMRIGSDPTRPWLIWAAALGGHGATAALAVGERAATAVLRALDG